MYADRRLRVLFGIVALLLAFAASRAVWFAFAESDTLSNKAQVQQDKSRTILAARGDIRDRDGQPLVVGDLAYDVSIYPAYIPREQRAKLAALISRSLRLPADEVSEAVNSGKNYVRIGRNIADDKVEALKREAAKKKLAINQIELEPRNRRSYPLGYLMGQVLGSYGDDDKALSGLESAFDKYLRGTNGKELETQAKSGSALRTIVKTEMKPGKNIGLTINSEIQTMTESALMELGAKFRPKRATAVVMQPDGRLLAMANWPRVDPSDPTSAPEIARRNMSVGFSYEPGSTFKLVAAAGALEDKKVTPKTRMVIPYQIQFADKTIRDSHSHPTEEMTPGEILAQSSNVGAIKIGGLLGDQGFYDWMKKFGFGNPTGIGMGEEQGVLLPPKKYSGSTMANLPIGQGMLVTPMQIAGSYAAVANGGVLRPPMLLNSVDGKPVKQPEGKRILRPEVAKQLRTMLTGVFEAGGTASAVKVPGYTLAGKTGTSNIYDTTLKRYVEGKNVASIAGFAPANKPEVVIVVVADQPAGGGYGAAVAGPAFGQIAQFALRNLKVPTG